MQDTPERRYIHRYQRIVIVLQFILGTILLAMVVTSALSLFGRGNWLLAPTPTATATSSAFLTATPSFRARIMNEDRATQEAYRTLAAANALISPLGKATATQVQPTHTVMVPLVVSGGEPTSTPTPIPQITEPVSVIHIPDVSNNPQPDSPLPAATQDSGSVTPPDVNNGEQVPPDVLTETPTETATETPTEIPTDTPLPTAVVATETPTFTPTPFIVANLRAFVTVAAGVTPYVGPSTQYTVAVNSLAYNNEINLTHRDETGEWVAACCMNNVMYWVRQAYVPPRDNSLQAGAPAGADANDVRWLAVMQAPPTTEPILTPTAVPDAIFPFYRVRRGNNATQPALPAFPLQPDWANPFQATAPMNSAVLVTGNYVIGGSEDNHLYALDLFGNLQRSYNANQRIIAGPLLQDGNIYLVTQSGQSFALNGNLDIIWQSTVNGTPFTPLYQSGNRLFIGVQETEGKRIVRIDRNNAGTLFAERFPFTDGNPLSAMAIGNQSIYIGDAWLKAVDLNKLTFVWEQNATGRLTAPPVYVNNGTQALAELYVADEQNRLHLIDANTGRIIWTAGVGRRITGIVVGPDAIYASGDGFLLAWPRRNGSLLWSRDIPGETRGGPILSPNRILIVTNTGNIRIFDLNGIELVNVSLPSGVQLPDGAAPAVSGLYIFVPGTDGRIHAFRGQP